MAVFPQVNGVTSGWGNSIDTFAMCKPCGGLGEPSRLFRELGRI